MRRSAALKRALKFAAWITSRAADRAKAIEQTGVLPGWSGAYRPSGMTERQLEAIGVLAEQGNLVAIQSFVKREAEVYDFEAHEAIFREFSEARDARRLRARDHLKGVDEHREGQVVEFEGAWYCRTVTGWDLDGPKASSSSPGFVLMSIGRPGDQDDWGHDPSTQAELDRRNVPVAALAQFGVGA